VADREGLGIKDRGLVKEEKADVVNLAVVRETADMPDLEEGDHKYELLYTLR
jgi:hypothetical protein